MSKNVYVSGAGGLGNCLFQVSAAIYYCEKHNYNLKLIKNNTLLFGTSNYFGKNQMLIVNDEYITYDKTIFNKITFIDEITTSCSIHNDYTNNKLHNLNDQDILISGCNQNLNLFNEVFNEIPKYLNITDKTYETYIFNKYGDISSGTVICLRKGTDFLEMTKITQKSYINALKCLNLKENDKIYIISDVPVNNYFEDNNFIEINESDIIQFYFGLSCKNYILSESTFHLWISYLGTDFGKNVNKNVICFNDTDITNRKLDIETFIKIDY